MIKLITRPFFTIADTGENTGLRDSNWRKYGYRSF